jgi:hypothetical protein
VEAKPKSSDHSHVRALAQRRPARKSAQVRWFWPQIRAALAAGHSIADVRRELALDGLDISYSKLRTYIGRLRKQDHATGRQSAPAGDSVTGDSQCKPTPGSEPAPDPLFNVRRQLDLKKRTSFEYNPFPDPNDQHR